MPSKLPQVQAPTAPPLSRRPALPYFGGPPTLSCSGPWYLPGFPTTLRVPPLLRPPYSSSSPVGKHSVLIDWVSMMWKGLPRWLSGQESACQCRSLRRHGFDSWVGKIPWRRPWQPIPVFLPGEPMNRGVCWATVHGVAKSRTQLKQLRPHTCRSLGYQNFCLIWLQLEVPKTPSPWDSVIFASL